MKLLIKVWNLKYKTMPSYCLKCRKNTESIKIQASQKITMVKQWYYQNVQYVVVKNQDLLKKKKKVEY